MDPKVDSKLTEVKRWLRFAELGPGTGGDAARVLTEWHSFMLLVSTTQRPPALVAQHPQLWYNAAREVIGALNIISERDAMRANCASSSACDKRI